MRRRLAPWLLALLLCLSPARPHAAAAPAPAQGDRVPLAEGTAAVQDYQEGQPLSGAPDFALDVKRVDRTGDRQQLVNHASGYRVTVPASLDWDFTLAERVVKAASPALSVTLSLEHSPYADLDGYLDFYQNRFYESAAFRGANRLTLLEDTTLETAGFETRLLTLRYEAQAGDLPYSVYTFAYQKTGGQNYARYLFRSGAFDAAHRAEVRAVLNSFAKIERRGRAHSPLHPTLRAECLWDRPTRALWDRYRLSEGVDWGIFVQDMYGAGIRETIPALEQQIGKPFEVVLMYHQFGTPLELEGMREAARQQKTIELTLQVCHNNNQDVYGYSPMFDLVAGRRDEQLRALAAQLKAFGKPLLFRLNNEMNSDWTSYSGIVTLGDPELYVLAWQRVYKIFYQEGVRNAIWVFNPNDRNYPPSNWNDYTCYWPGDGYVHMIGVTGYNTGTYYRNLTGETWREFDAIYGEIARKYLPLFEQYPWIITEFASSSHGGDKARWIDGMFSSLPNYRNIKVAVWWSYADYDLRPGSEHIPARPYFLDETGETLQAFARGRMQP